MHASNVMFLFCFLGGGIFASITISIIESLVKKWQVTDVGGASVEHGRGRPHSPPAPLPFLE